MFVVLMLHVLISSCSANVTYDVMLNTGVPDSCLLKQVQGVFSAGSCSIMCLLEGPPCATIELRYNQICRLGSCLAAIEPNANIVAYGKFGCPTDYDRVGQACYRLIKELYNIDEARAACASESGNLALPETEEQLRALISYITILNPQKPASPTIGYRFGVYIGLRYEVSSRKLMRQGDVLNVADEMWAHGCPIHVNNRKTDLVLYLGDSFRMCNVSGGSRGRFFVCQKD